MAAPARRAPDPTHARVKTPTVLQMEAVECGAAALAIILAYHGRVVPLVDLRLACGVSRDGSKAINILRAARRYGLAATGKKWEPESLPAQQPPFIVWWNFNHFLVVEGFHKGWVYLNDPAAGPRKVSWDEFDHGFTGVALFFEPGPGFEKGGQFPSLIGGLRSRLAGMQGALTFVILVGLCLVLPGLVVPIFSQVFVDNVLLGANQSWFRPLLAAMAVTMLVQVGLTWLQQAYLLRLESKLALAASGRFFWHVLRLPAEFFSQRYAGDISFRVGSNDRVASLLSGELATNAINLVQAVFFAAVMLAYDVTLTLVGISIIGLNVAALRYVSRIRKDGNRRLLQDQGKLMGTAYGGLQMIESLKASGTESDFFLRWAGFQAKVVNGHQSLQRASLFLNAVPPLLTSISTAVILGLGGYRVIEGAMTMGMLVAFQSLMTGFTTPANRLVALGGSLQEVEGDLTRLDDVLKNEIDPSLAQADADAVPEDESIKLDGHLELRSVTFGYSRLDPPLISDFSLTVRPGARVALVGGSGSGKSTVAKLITGLYEPWSGEVLLDGRRRDQIPRPVLANSLALVDQDIFLFEGTVRDNLALWDASVPDPILVDAMKDACIEADVSARQGGLRSLVDEEGANFSGGQRQRLEIARALAVNPRVLVLDEATSALDATTEKEIDDGLRRRACTCVIVAHRLSTIRDADEIIVLQRGRVVQRGTHEELLQDAEGTYAQLISAE